MKQIAPMIYKHQYYVEPINLTFNQYLLTGSSSVLIHTGDYQHSHTLIEAIQSTLGDSSLSYIFVSHFESDECGALSPLLEAFPHAKVVASEVTQRQIKGFGLTDQVLSFTDAQTLATGEFTLEAITYPSEMHLWDGLLCYDRSRNIFFSSDLFIRFGKEPKSIEHMSWEDLVHSISLESVPHPEKLEALKKRLLGISVKQVAPGHGSLITIKEG
ncbi:MAG: hypothetical protein WCY81_04170 [Sphaerochaetaceae bacterium]|jgi:flavorubredoxin